MSANQITSVASCLLSRIDTKVDARLHEGSPLRGRVALASARVAYQRYIEKFRRPGWDRLRQLGAKPQRPLWASTGTKNPEFSDVLYVSQLIGPDVVNTMPEQTLRAFIDHGEVKPTLVADPAAAEGVAQTSVHHDLSWQGHSGQIRGLGPGREIDLRDNVSRPGSVESGSAPAPRGRQL